MTDREAALEEARRLIAIRHDIPSRRVDLVADALLRREAKGLREAAQIALREGKPGIAVNFNHRAAEIEAQVGGKT